MSTSQNGYPANDVSRTSVWTVPGTDRQIRLAKGECGFVLVHFAAWFDKNVESVDGGILDDWGYAERPIRGSSTTLSNHASGTAMDLNAPRHPLGARGTFTPAQAAAIRRVLADTYGGVIRWGGDYRNRADEMHFEIDAPYRDVVRVARRLRAAAKPAPKPSPAPEPAAKPKRERRVPEVSVSRVRHSAKTEPPARGSLRQHPRMVRVLERALVAEGLLEERFCDGHFGTTTRDAYAAWQRRLGYRGADADGVPGHASLLELGRRHGFRVSR